MRKRKAQTAVVYWKEERRQEMSELLVVGRSHTVLVLWHVTLFLGAVKVKDRQDSPFSLEICLHNLSQC